MENVIRSLDDLSVRKVIVLPGKMVSITSNKQLQLRNNPFTLFSLNRGSYLSAMICQDYLITVENGYVIIQAPCITACRGKVIQGCLIGQGAIRTLIYKRLI